VSDGVNEGLPHLFAARAMDQRVSAEHGCHLRGLAVLLNQPHSGLIYLRLAGLVSTDA
jgi:hypothetical protein